MHNLTLEKILESCRSGDPYKQVPAIIKLREMKAYESVPTLIELLSSPDDEVRIVAAEALGCLGDKEIETVGAALVKMLTDSAELVRSNALDALAILGYTSAIESIKPLLSNDPEWLVRVSAIEALANLAEVGDSGVLAQLELALDDTFDPVRSYSAWAIGLLATPEFLLKLQEHLASELSLSVKASILAARYRLGIREDLNQFLDLLKSGDPYLAVQILNMIKDLAENNVPLTLVADVPRICEAIMKATQFLTFERVDAEQVIAQLEGVKIQAQILGFEAEVSNA